VVPSAAWAEKEGTWVNRDGRLQRLRAVVPAPGEALSDITWLQQVLVAMGQRPQVLSTEGVFRQAMPGLDYKVVGSLGVVPGPDLSPTVSDEAALGAK
jgi:NADH dehydrogenase/NADH:ubiquinone oxidoreductase subunit G